MGSWYGTCAVTNLAICDGDPVRMILLSEQGYGPRIGGGFCHHTDLWSPVASPLAGSYDGHGRVRDIMPTGLHELAIAWLREWWIDPPRDDRDVPTTAYRVSLSWPGVIAAVERGVALVREPLSERLLPRSSVEHPDGPGPVEIFDALRKADWCSSFSDGAVKAIAVERHRSIKLDDEVKDLRDYVEAMRRPERREHRLLSMVLIHERVYVSMVETMGERPLRTMRGDADGSMLDGVRQSIVDGMDASASGERWRVRDAIWWLSREQTAGGLDLAELVTAIAGREDRDALADDLADFVCFDWALASMRKHYAPQAGAGSQDDEHGLHLAIGDQVRAIIDERADLD